MQEEFDLRSTFVSKARLKVDSKPPPPPKKEKAARPEGKDPEGKEQQQVRAGLTVLSGRKEGIGFPTCSSQPYIF